MTSLNKSLSQSVKQLKNESLFRKLNITTSQNSPTQIINEESVINLCSNNYLGFANLDRMKKVAINAINTYGVGSGSVRTINGNTDLHEKLDETIAKFKKEEAAHHFQSGFNCNMGVLSSIATPEDILISDELNHASIIDGIRLTKSQKAIYKHSNMQHLEDILKEKRKLYNNAIIITDGVFSMDGDIAKLPDIQQLAEKYNASIYVDDAHGSGVLGKNGRGTVDHFNLHGKIDIIVGTLSKAIGSIGGYVTGSNELYDWLNHRSRPILFSTSLPPASVAVAIEAFNILMETSTYTDNLWENALFFQNLLKENNFNIGKTQTPITPLMIGSEEKALKISQLLLKEKIFASPIVYPTVAKNTARIRFMIRADHTKDQLSYVVDVLNKLRQKENF